MSLDIDTLLRRLATPEALTAGRAPARLQARIYSALINKLSETQPLQSLADLKTFGAGLCVFEEALAVIPFGGKLGTLNPCRLCHARVLAERVDHAPIFWRHCPYAAFHRRSRA
jgi:hypothetical protein